VLLLGAPDCFSAQRTFYASEAFLADFIQEFEKLGPPMRDEWAKAA
jgi:hypothetical protein